MSKPTFKEWIHEKVENIKAIPKKAWNGIKENPEIVPLIGAGVTLVGTLAELSVHKDEMLEKREDRKTWTDPDTGLTWKLDRPLTNEENRQIMETKRLKMDVVEALDEMNVLK